ncbi:hypothetical protein Cylst_1557 [Cylindrospermum stagnale PCC 7417]|uniref:Uncharacterized protein n=1 Tax=Cylindrospermum stagnale PCC 7417 TaxID=56107 RepID=K9WTX8_9NOST|nr:hypothetical protein Cylst_1557 [Cylindrospermum stagnale PCC 7417]
MSSRWIVNLEQIGVNFYNENPRLLSKQYGITTYKNPVSARD